MTRGLAADPAVVVLALRIVAGRAGREAGLGSFLPGDAAVVVIGNRRRRRRRRRIRRYCYCGGGRQ
jgi:hypothetical protein